MLDAISMSKVSIIVPIYNTAHHLQKCLNSLCSQSLKDIEIICVDDCSTDNSLSIVRDYAVLDARIQILKFKNNKGAAAARNAGLAIARGEFVGFMDSDDFIDSKYYEELYCAAIRDKCDIAKAIYYGETKDEKEYQINYNKKISKDKYKFSINFTTAIYKRSLIENHAIDFPEGVSNFEDIYFLVKAVFFANKITTINTVCYYYVNRKNSASRHLSLHSIETICDASYLIASFINCINIKNEYYNYIFHRFIVAIFSVSLKFEYIPDDIFVKVLSILALHRGLKCYIDDFQKYTLNKPADNFFKIREVFFELQKNGYSENDIITNINNFCTCPKVCIYLDVPVFQYEKILLSLIENYKNFIKIIFVTTNSIPSVVDWKFIKKNKFLLINIEQSKFLAAGASLVKNSEQFSQVRSFALPRLELLRLIGGLTVFEPETLCCYFANANSIGGCAGIIANVPHIMLSYPECFLKYDAKLQNKYIYQFFLSHPRVSILKM